MDFDKKTILAFLLIAVVYLIWTSDFYQKRFGPPQRPNQETSAETQTQPLPNEQQEPEKAQTRSVEKPAPITRAVESSQENELPEQSRYAHLRGDGEEINVETDRYKAVFSSSGATLKSWELKEYFLEDGRPVEIIKNQRLKNLGVLLPTSIDTINTAELVFSSNKQSISLNGTRETEKLEFVLELDEYQKLKKTYIFYRDRYDFSLEIELINMNGLIEGYSYLLDWRAPLNSTEPDFRLDMDKTKAFVHQGDDEEFNVKNDFDTERFDNPTDWVAVRTKYFAAAVIPQGFKGQKVTFVGRLENVGQEVPLKKYAFELSVPFGRQSNEKKDVTIYLGPLDYDTIKSYNVELEKIMDLGIALFRPIGKLVLTSFTLLHKLIPNYGFVIIVFSILIKILLFPLTRKSYQSMKAMQTLQPLMQEINEKYKSDPQKKQQEIMKLYKEHGVNPLGGCIPMILQMPLLFALFRIFQSTIELRQASFIWWIHDLSRPDTIATLPFNVPLFGNTINILPLVMGVTMFIQQKIAMKDPKQKAMVYFMPIFLTLLFNRFPSGLNLYYALFNLLTIIQEKVIPHKKKAPVEVKAQKKPKRRRKHDYRGGVN